MMSKKKNSYYDSYYHIWISLLRLHCGRLKAPYYVCLYDDDDDRCKRQVEDMNTPG